MLLQLLKLFKLFKLFECAALLMRLVLEVADFADAASADTPLHRNPAQLRDATELFDRSRGGSFTLSPLSGNELAELSRRAAERSKFPRLTPCMTFALSTHVMPMKGLLFLWALFLLA